MDYPDFKFVSTIDDFNKHLPQCTIQTGKYLCFETFACVFILRVIYGVPNLCFYYELPAETQRTRLLNTKIVNHNTTILLHDAEKTVVERINRSIAWQLI
jgi:hypothetical protein